jgi:DNA repair exonuclease SbcCD ATPase subunit
MVLVTVRAKHLLFKHYHTHCLSTINSIRKDNLVNRTNGKNMMVTLEFTVNGIDYKIERGLA